MTSSDVFNVTCYITFSSTSEKLDTDDVRIGDETPGRNEPSTLILGLFTIFSKHSLL